VDTRAPAPDTTEVSARWAVASLGSLTLETRNSEPPRNSMLGLSPRTPSATSEASTMITAIRYQVRRRPMKSIDRSPV